MKVLITVKYCGLCSHYNKECDEEKTCLKFIDDLKLGKEYRWKENKSRGRSYIEINIKNIEELEARVALFNIQYPYAELNVTGKWEEEEWL